MAGKTAYLERKLIDLTTKGSTAAPYTQSPCWVGLFTAAPSDSGGGTEVSGGSYARKSTAAADWSAAATVSGVSSASNANAITFVPPTASWGTVTHFGLFDAATAGNLLRWGTLTTPKALASGDNPSFAAGVLVITED